MLVPPSLRAAHSPWDTRSMAQTYCTAPECEDATRQGRRYCEFHEKRHQRGQSLTEPKAERLSPKARLVEVALRLADADGDEEYAQAERDLVRTAKQSGPLLHGELVRQGMAEAKRRGVKLGPPFTVDPLKVQETVTREGSIAAAARALSISRPTVYRALGRVTQAPIPLHRAA